MRRGQARRGSTRSGRRNPQGSTSRPEAFAADCSHPARGHSLDRMGELSTEGQAFLLTPHTGCFCTGHGTCPLGCLTQIKRQTRLFSFSFLMPPPNPSLPSPSLPQGGKKKNPKPTPSPWLALVGREWTVRNYKALLLEERVVRCRVVWGTGSSQPR